ncbi:P-loop containing nucleoside triphosphate hydrolase superfamily protein [Abeliophyllum distichum]|uniref:P-loop containing nucleoside triphosphate hydrolase superfamily protein n=1 Tax=Abeliophyllum distichum TaxID=126358 RepID=A0ABD1PSA1_9LAMI
MCFQVYFAGLGSLKNVRAALCRGRVLKCSRCRRPGATIGCRVDQCPKSYHLPCAQSKGCIFDHCKFLIACTDHRNLFQPHGIQYLHRLKKMKLEMRKMTKDACHNDIEAEEKWLENCGAGEEFFKRESKRLHRDLLRIAPVYIGGANSENKTQYRGWESVAGLQDVVRALIGSCARGDKRIAYFARKGADCLGKYVGDAECQLRLLFQVAEKSQPSIIFFDEIDGLAPCRSEQQDQTHSSVVSTLLALMDGLKSRGSVIGATNRPDAVDPALRWPGRFDREIYFPLPSVKDREAILSLHTQKWPKPITGPLLKWVAYRTVGFAGADLQALCTQAAIIVLRRSFPLQEVLSAAGAKASHGRCPPIPIFTVEERDWLEALSCAAPPCSQRETGITVNDMASSPLDTSLIPSLLRPLTRLLVSLHLNEGVWLPLPLDKATTLIKNVIISALDRKRMQSNNWWMHVDDLLQEKDVANEIENNLSLVNILIEGPNSCSFNALEDNSDDGCLKFFPSNFQHIGACSGLLQYMSHISGSESGFQLLISGNPRSGQRHLASCLLHCFVCNIDVWKVDLASISQEGHGDMVLGLTQMLMRCAGMQSCMIFMPRVDLWVVETFKQANDEYSDSPLMEPQSSEKMSIAEHCEVDKEHDLCPSAKETEVAVSQTAIKNASYLWNSFVELVDLIRVHTSLMILATSEIPLSFFPHRIKQFFERETVKCSLSSPLQDKVPRFSVQLDGSYDYNMVIDSVAVKLSKDLAQHFVHLIHCRNYIHANSFKDKTCDTNKGDVDSVYPRERTRSTTVLDSISCPVSPAASMNNTIKGKSSLLLAISTFGYQILFYPHFGELCWVTSKLKEGPSARIDGPWKVWPFNSCIVRPVKPAEKVDAASGSSNIKSKEKSGVVRGLVAVGLSAYRGQYTSLKDVSSEVRKVLELVVGRINDKIQAGKARNQFFHLLAQVAYLEDMVINWAHTLQSLEADAQLSEARLNACTGSLNKGITCKDGHSQGDGLKLDILNGSINEQKMLEESREFDVKVVECPNSCNSDNSCSDAGDKIAVTLQEPSKLVVSNNFSPIILSSAPNEVYFAAPNDVNFHPSKPEAAGFCAEFGVNDGSIKHSNEITERCFDIKADGPGVSGDKHDVDLSNSVRGCSQDNDLPSKDTNENSGGNDLDVNYSLKFTGLLSGSFAMCLYHCCFDCLVAFTIYYEELLILSGALKEITLL